MKYRVINCFFSSATSIDDWEEIRYKLQRCGWFGIWWTVTTSTNREKLEKMAHELNNYNKFKK